jgi:hypothetical protein
MLQLRCALPRLSAVAALLITGEGPAIWAAAEEK